MKLFQRRATTTDVPTELKPYYTAPESGMSRVVWTVGRIALLVLALILLVWAGVWAVSKLSSHSKNQASTNSKTSQQGSDNKSSGSKQQSGTVTQPAPSSSSTSPSQSTGGTTQNSTSTPQQPSSPAALPNTGG